MDRVAIEHKIHSLRSVWSGFAGILLFVIALLFLFALAWVPRFCLKPRGGESQ